MRLAWLARYFGRSDYVPLSAQDLEALARASREVDISDGCLYREGEEAVAAFVIRAGPVELRRGRGQSYRCLGMVRPGAVLGDAEMFLGKPYFASANVLGPVHAIRFDRDQTMRELAIQPRIALRWLLASMRHIDACHHRVMQLLRKSVLARVADLLIEEHETTGAATLSQQEMARLLGVSRSAVNRAVRALDNEGVISPRYRSVQVLDAKALTRIAAESG